MGFKCEVCNETFTRCSYLLHKSESRCYNHHLNETATFNKVCKVPEDSSSKIDESVSVPLKKAGNDGSVEVLQNDALFMVVNLNGTTTNEEYTISLDFDEAEVEVGGAMFTTDNVNMDELNDDQLLDIVVMPEDVIENQLNADSRLSTDSVISGVDAEETLNDVEEMPANCDTQIPAATPADKGLTKKGLPRKRSTPNTKKPSKLQRQQEKHPLQNPCNENMCRRKCSQKISEERRQAIYNQFWSLNDIERKLFVLGNVERLKVNRKTCQEGGLPIDSRRNNSFRYSFLDASRERKIICKPFFLGTLGYEPKNDKFIFNVLNKSDMTPSTDMRGKHTPPNKLDSAIIKEHILTYNPCVSHYRREHAPLRKYLPTEVNIATMHSDFSRKHPRIKCSYDKYRCVVAEMNISFTKLGHEECEKCETHKNHNSDHYKEPDNSCDQCQLWLKHKEKYTEARKLYQSHIDKVNNEEFNNTINGTVVYSMDLQKVLMLPMMEQFKEVIFTKRIVVFNESFVPLGTQNKALKPIACIWHEGCSGRKKEDIMSAVHSFCIQNRDAKNIALWMDNCAAQNKNWALFSYMVWLVNSNEIEADTIELNYLEAGHTFMSADSFHHQVTKQLKQKGKVYDFDDFTDAVQNSNSSKVIVSQLTKQSDFFETFDYSSTYVINKTNPRPYLSEMVQVVFVKGSLQLKYKTAYNSEEGTLLTFLQTKYMKKNKVPNPPIKSKLRGVNREKQTDIINKLVPLMPQNHHKFWKDLILSDVPDLTVEVDDY